MDGWMDGWIAHVVEGIHKNLFLLIIRVWVVSCYSNFFNTSTLQIVLHNTTNLFLRFIHVLFYIGYITTQPWEYAKLYTFIILPIDFTRFEIALKIKEPIRLILSFVI
jgi:hypothetical protein